MLTASPHILKSDGDFRPGVSFFYVSDDAVCVNGWRLKKAQPIKQFMREDVVRSRCGVAGHKKLGANENGEC